MFEQIASDLSLRVADETERRFGIRPANVRPAPTPRFDLGDLAFSFAFEVAKRKGDGLKPRAVAEALAPVLAGAPFVRRVEVAGAGYINVYLDRGAVARALIAAAKARAPLGCPLFPGKAIIEHTNINPNKAAHVGHVRNAVLGDTLARLLCALGHPVEVENYIDDTGVQVADVVVGFLDLEGKDLAAVKAVPPPFDHYCWDLYARVGRWYEEDPARKARQHEVLKLIEEGSNPTAELADHVARTVVGQHLRTMARLGIDYDLLAWEGDILRLGLWARTFEKLKATSAVYLATEGKNQGCWMMRLEGTKGFEGLADADKVLVRSNGTATYVAKDIAYQMWKFGLSAIDFRYLPHPGERRLWSTTSQAGETPPHAFGGAARVYNVIDIRQGYLQDVVARSLEALGYEAQSKNSIHYAYEMVALTPRCAEEMGFALEAEDRKRPFVEMSGRKGLGIKADDLIDHLTRRAQAEVKAHHAGMADDEVLDLARAIAVGALRYFMLRFGRLKIVAFDFEEALRFQGETGPYLQNSMVRAASIFRKAAERGMPEETPERLDPEKDLAALDELEREDESWSLVLALARLDEVLGAAVSTLELSLVARWAFETAQVFHKYYERFRIVGEPDAARRRERAALVWLYQSRMARALDLMGIPVPERM